MPGYKKHIAGGCVVYMLLAALIAYLFWVPPLAVHTEWLFVALAGALFPDIDIKSKGQKYFYHFFSLVCLLLFIHQCYTSLALMSVGMCIPLMVNHRGLFHRLWFIVLFPSVGAAVAISFMPACYDIIFYDTLFFIAGACSHLWLDYGVRRMFRW